MIFLLMAAPITPAAGRSARDGALSVVGRGRRSNSVGVPSAAWRYLAVATGSRRHHQCSTRRSRAAPRRQASASASADSRVSAASAPAGSPSARVASTARHQVSSAAWRSATRPTWAMTGRRSPMAFPVIDPGDPSERVVKHGQVTELCGGGEATNAVGSGARWVCGVAIVA